ncbi:MAG: type II toxin-antitoxin system RelE/ParE family toxin [Archangium sp.]|nr:type II toxin-antitoxin system RelE/ParE family toxin [Archangium sp.]MDP3571832.1 type II toxin-antitoxin system RelE/ParE family toxin [Archangium sp.]
MKRFSVRWAAVARDDLERIVSYVALSSVKNALAAADRLEKLAESLHTLPHRGRVVPELERHGIREWRQVTEAPWRLIYRVDKVEIVALVDARRSLEDLLFERLMHSD